MLVAPSGQPVVCLDTVTIPLVASRLALFCCCVSQTAAALTACQKTEEAVVAQLSKMSVRGVGPVASLLSPCCLLAVPPCALVFLFAPCLRSLVAQATVESINEGLVIADGPGDSSLVAGGNALVVVCIPAVPSATCAFF